MKKKLLLFVMLVASLVCLFTISASAVEYEGIHYYLNNDNTASVIGDNRANCKLTKVDIPEKITVNGVEYTVTKIDGSAFGNTDVNYANQTITEVIIPKSVTSIGSHAFRNCKKVTKITVNAEIVNLSNAEFYDMDALKEVAFTSTTFKSTGQYTFRYCENLKKVTLPEGFESFGSETFAGCTSLSEINVPSTLKSIGGKAFNGCSSLTSFDFPEGLTEIWENCFQNAGLTKVILPESLKTTAKDIFNNCPITLAVLPADLSGFVSSLFSSCSRLKTVIYTGTDASVAKGAISQIKSFNTDSFTNFDPTVEYTTGTIFAGAIRSELDSDVLLGFAGFDKPFAKCDMKTNQKTTYEAVMTSLGYSISANGNGIATGFRINAQSLEDYEVLFNKKLNFGVVMFNPEFLDDTSILDANNEINAPKGVLKMDINPAYKNCSILISGFDVENNEAHRLLELVCAGYVYTNNDKSDITFIQREYIGTDQAGVISPMASKVTRGDIVLYTVKLSTVATPIEITTDKAALDEYVKKATE